MMRSTPRVSVITPAYNVARYIGQAIESVQAQTLTDWEMIIVDDASPDETVQVVRRYLGDPRIKLLQNEQNMGAGYTRNRALDVAQGEWIAILDADDQYAPERLEKLWRLAQEKEAFVFSDLHLIIDDEGKNYRLMVDDTGKKYKVSFPPHLKLPREPTRYTVREYIFHHIPIKPFANREYIQRHHIRYLEDVVTGQDFIFQVQLLLHGSDLWILPEPNYFYRVQPESITRRLGSQLELRNFLFDRLRELEGIRDNPELVRCVEVARRRFLLPIRYRRFVESIRNRQWCTSWQYFSADVAAMFIKRLPGAIYRRLHARERLKEPREGT